MNKNGFDERQILTRYKIGFQSFFILLFLVFVDGFVRDSGINWASNIDGSEVIFFIVIIYFTLRAIIGDAYYCKKNADRFNFMMKLFAACSLFILLVLFIKLIIGNLDIISNGQLQDSSVTLLVCIYLATTSITYWIKRIHEKRSEHNS